MKPTREEAQSMSASEWIKREAFIGSLSEQFLALVEFLDALHPGQLGPVGPAPAQPSSGANGPAPPAGCGAQSWRSFDASLGQIVSRLTAEVEALSGDAPKTVSDSELRELEAIFGTIVDRAIPILAKWNGR